MRRGSTFGVGCLSVNVDRYCRVWDGTETGWVLLRADEPPELSDVIYNTETRMMLVIEDDDLASQVRARMLAQGARVIEEIPPGDFDPGDECRKLTVPAIALPACLR